MPLMWAHAEYVKLLRSAADGTVIDQVPEVAERSLSGAGKKRIEVWKSVVAYASCVPAKCSALSAKDLSAFAGPRTSGHLRMIRRRKRTRSESTTSI
jgi:hypothetical protein